ncbi:MAG: hypothetical protein Q4D38_00160 [Planctomycetia bacterium]|nr:hypothetical protein [Planctomycetia bacterium]
MNFRALKVSLCKLQGDNPSKASRGEFIGEIISAALHWSLNTIPTATVVLPLGVKLTSDATKPESSYVYAKIMPLIMHREPVGLFLDIEVPEHDTHNIDNRELPYNKRICIFKGYMDMPAIQLGTTNTYMQVQLTHWLCDTAIFPLLHRLSHPENPMDYATHAMYGIGSVDTFSSSSNGFNWIPIIDDIHKHIEGGKVFTAIKTTFQHFITEGNTKLSDKDPGHISTDLLNREQYALDSIIEDSSATLSEALTGNEIRLSIHNILANKEAEKGYYATPWRKLTGQLLPLFLLSCVPMVDKVMVIPSPGIAMKSINPKIIKTDSIVHYSSSKKLSDTLGYMIAAPNASMFSRVNRTNINTVLLASKYPEQPKPGVGKVCNIPAWIVPPMLSNTVPETEIRATSEDAVSIAEQDNKEQEDKINKQIDVATDWIKKYTATMYGLEVLRYNSANIRTVLRFDLLPGSVICIEEVSDILAKEEAVPKQYGTIAETVISLSNNGVSTDIKVINMRTEEQLKDEDITPSGNLVYSSAWNAVDSYLYSDEEELTNG